MELKITQQFDNKLLHRKEVQGYVTFAGPTPSNKDVQLELATQLNTSKELVVVDHIYNTYGTQGAKVFAKTYVKKEFLEQYEPNKKEVKKEGGAAEGAPAEAPAEGSAPAEKKPAEGKPAEAAPKEQEKKEEKPEPPKEGHKEEAK